MDDEHIYLDYGGQFYPYCYVPHDKILTGVYVELWKIVARVMKKKIVWQLNREEGSSVDGQMNPSQKRIHEGVALTFVDTSFYDYEDSHDFKPSVPFSYTKAMLYERQHGPEQEQSAIIFFVVFSWDAIMLIIVTLIIVSILSSLQMRRQREHWGVSSIALTLSNALITIGVTVIAYHHSAGFRGNNIVISPPVTPTFEEAVLSMRSGRRTLLLSGDADLYESQEQFLTGNRSTVDVPKVIDALYTICGNQTLIAPFYDNQLLAMNLVNNSCKVSGIEGGKVQGQRIPYDLHYGIEDPAFFLFAKNTTGRTIELVNRVILRLFQQDQIDNLWTAHFMQSIRKLDFSPPVKEIEYRPFNLSRLCIIFFVYLACIPLQIGTLLAEIIVYRQKVRV